MNGSKIKLFTYDLTERQGKMWCPKLTSDFVQ